MHFVLRCTKGGGSSTDCLTNHVKSKHRIYESEKHKTMPVQEEIRSQIVMKEMILFEATKKRSNNLEKLFHALIRGADQRSTMRAISAWLLKFKRNSNVVSNLWVHRLRFFIAHCCMLSLWSENGLNRENVSITFLKRRNYASWHFPLWRNMRLNFASAVFF